MIFNNFRLNNYFDLKFSVKIYNDKRNIFWKFLLILRWWRHTNLFYKVFAKTPKKYDFIKNGWKCFSIFDKFYLLANYPWANHSLVTYSSKDMNFSKKHRILMTSSILWRHSDVIIIMITVFESSLSGICLFKIW